MRGWRARMGRGGIDGASLAGNVRFRQNPRSKKRELSRHAKAVTGCRYQPNTWRPFPRRSTAATQPKQGRTVPKPIYLSGVRTLYCYGAFVRFPAGNTDGFLSGAAPMGVSLSVRRKASWKGSEEVWWCGLWS